VFDNIKIDIKEKGCEDVDVVYLTQHGDKGLAVVKTVVNHLVP
jgi:hypothetical protein